MRRRIGFLRALSRRTSRYAFLYHKAGSIKSRAESQRGVYTTKFIVKVLELLLDREGVCCRFCEGVLEFGSGFEMTAEIDRETSRDENGDKIGYLDVGQRLSWTCGFCNHSKGAFSLDDFLELLTLIRNSSASTRTSHIPPPRPPSKGRLCKTPIAQRVSSFRSVDKSRKVLLGEPATLPQVLDLAAAQEYTCQATNIRSRFTNSKQLTALSIERLHNTRMDEVGMITGHYAHWYANIELNIYGVNIGRGEKRRAGRDEWIARIRGLTDDEIRRWREGGVESSVLVDAVTAALADA